MSMPGSFPGDVPEASNVTLSSQQANGTEPDGRSREYYSMTRLPSILSGSARRFRLPGRKVTFATDAKISDQTLTREEQHANWGSKSPEERRRWLKDLAPNTPEYVEQEHEESDWYNDWQECKKKKAKAGAVSSAPEEEDLSERSELSTHTATEQPPTAISRDRRRERKALRSERSGERDKKSRDSEPITSRPKRDKTNQSVTPSTQGDQGRGSSWKDLGRSTTKTATRGGSEPELPSRRAGGSSGRIKPVISYHDGESVTENDSEKGSVKDEDPGSSTLYTVRDAGRLRRSRNRRFSAGTDETRSTPAP